ncbi:MAG: transposase [Candidatus Magnetoglobus multicellularis str. Araruama]|uniref:Transposase n=1 Tax=Candidatus Magnetoglobus multicellularis str. Araruama TaxID=890399 RepID=A0A1V1P6T1_9BACT|nr:MAG: transposase [Candidatus Magnetoglobus multicellularis str. Araruama]
MGQIFTGGNVGKNELNGKLGFISTLHTWDQKMLYHLHLHCIIPGGALSSEGDKWNSSKPDYLFDVLKMSKTFREIFVKKLEKSYKKNELIFEGEIVNLGTQKGFEELINTLLSKEWVVYSKKPVSAEVVLDYLGRYVHRVAISNNRIVKVENDRVTFLYRDHSDGDLKSITVDVDEFIRRFFLHVLPDNFYRIRYYGFLSTRSRNIDLPKCREILGLSKELPALEEISVKQFMLDYAGIDISKCPYCQKGK